MTSFKRTEVVKYSKQLKTGKSDINWGRWEPPVTIQEYGAINRVDISPVDPHYFAITSYSKVLIYNPVVRDVFKTVTKFQDAAFGGKFRRDGKLLCVGTSEGLVKVFDVSTKTMLRVLRGHTTAVHQCEFTPDNLHVVSFSDDKSVGIWDIPTESQLDSLNGHTDYARCGATAAGSSDLLVSGSYDQTVLLWDRRNSTEPVVKINHGAPVEDVLFLPGDSILVSAGDNTIKVWDLTAGGRMLTSVSPHHKTVTSLCLADGGDSIVSASLDRQVKRIRMSDFCVTGSMSFPSSVLSIAVHPNDNYVVAGMSDGLTQIVERSKESVVDGIKVDGRRARRERSHRYLKYTHFTPNAGDIIIDGSKKDIETKYDHHLRSYNYTQALDVSLVGWKSTRQPEIIHSVLYELMRRDGLRRALAGRDEKSLTKVLTFVINFLLDIRFQQVLLHVADILVEMYLNRPDNSENINKLFTKLEAKLERKLSYDQELTKLQGCIDMILDTADTASATSTRIEKDLLKLKKS